MRVTRSRSAKIVPDTLKPLLPAKVAKVSAKSSQSSSSLSSTSASAIEASIKSDLNGKNNTSQSVKAVKTSKPHIEQAFAHITAPPDLALPSAFVEYHTPAFVHAINHVLKIDPSLYPAIAYDNFEAFSQENSVCTHEGSGLINHYWYALISSVISQQVSGSAAKAIKSRFRSLFVNTPTPQEALKVSADTLRSVGLSGMKVKYVVHISEVFADPTAKLASPDFYKSSTASELVAELTKLKGIGEWSANMFSVFTLKEIDVFAHDDLGVARGVARYLQVRPEVLAEVKAGVHAIEELKARLKRKSKFHSDKSKRDWTPVHDEYVKFLALKFEPCRTAFMLVMWRLSATDIEVLEKE